jgi:hypothetical protein
MVSEAWSEDYGQQTLVSHKRIQAEDENVVKVIVKFIEGEGKAPQEKIVGFGQMA